MSRRIQSTEARSQNKMPAVQDYSSSVRGNDMSWVATPTAIEMLRKGVEGETIIAVDTESDSFFSYFEKVCLLQVSTKEMDYIVDPLALADTNGIASLMPIFSSEHIEKVFHAATYDILCMKRDYCFEFKNIFDTMIAARILGWKNVGLGSILQERFGICLNKKMQKTNWGHRPLSAEQIDYAKEDTHYSLALRDLQLNELERLGRLEEAVEEFDRLTRIQPVAKCFNPNAYWSIRGAKDLDPISLGILRELFCFRDRQGRKENRPVFMVMHDPVLLRLAAMRPCSLQELSSIHSVSKHIIQRYGHAILDAINRGCALPQTTTPYLPSSGQVLLDNSARWRFARLKEWRKQRAISRGVDTDVIVSNDALFAAARKNPQTMESLAETSGLGQWKLQTYGEEILAVLQE